MQDPTIMKAELIAPCGINCSICIAFLREKKKCPGCHVVNNEKSDYCKKCRIKNCDKLQEEELEFCYECSIFPCQRMKQLDKRYRTSYEMSNIENLMKIKNEGINEFLETEKLKWTCKNCGGIVCVHRGCLQCNKGKKKLKRLGENL